VSGGTITKGISFFSWFGIPLPFETRLDLIKAAGFDATGGWLGPEEELVRSGRGEQMAARIRERGLILDYVHAPDSGCNDLWSDSARRRQEAQGHLRDHIAFCRKHTIPCLVIHISAGKGNQPEKTTSEGLKSISDAVQCAEDTGVIIAVENTQKPEFLDFIFSEISSPFLKFCYDTSHDFLYSAKPGALLSRWGHLLWVTHIGDNDGVEDRHWLPGKGTLPWNVMKRHFPVGTYEGYLNLEAFPTDQCQKAKDFLREAYESVLWLKGFLASAADI
jgi:sugar phosphate isomerase/epimerase